MPAGAPGRKAFVTIDTGADDTSRLDAHFTSSSRLLLVVLLSSKRALQAVRQGCCFAKKQESPLRSWWSSVASVWIGAARHSLGR